LAVYLDDKEMIFNRDFFDNTKNIFPEMFPEEKKFFDSIRLIKVSDFRPKSHIDIIINDDEGKAVAYLVSEEESKTEDDLVEGA